MTNSVSCLDIFDWACHARAQAETDGARAPLGCNLVPGQPLRADAPDGAGRPPPELDELGAAEWRRVAPVLESMGVLTAADVITEFAVPTPNARPTAITTGADGNVYFTQAGVTAAGELEIGKITAAGKITEIPLGFNVFEVGGSRPGPMATCTSPSATTTGSSSGGSLRPTR